MPKVIEAIFENGIFRPLKKEAHLKNHQRVRIEILSEGEESLVERQKKILLKVAGLGRGNSANVARKHDKYLYVRDDSNG